MAARKSVLASSLSRSLLGSEEKPSFGRFRWSASATVGKVVVTIVNSFRCSCEREPLIDHSDRRSRHTAVASMP